MASNNGSGNIVYSFPYYYIDYICLSTDSDFAYNNYFTSNIEQHTKDNYGFFPNPANNELNIKNPHRDLLLLNISTLEGVEIFNKPYNEKEILIDLSELPPGIFVLTIDSETGGRQRSKLIKQSQ